MSEKKMQGFKGFDKDLKCSGFQFEVGKTHVHEGEVKLCSSGFHFCEHPLNIFDYYTPAGSRFAKIEAKGVSEETAADTKRVCKTLRVKEELTVKSLVDAAVKFVFDHAEHTGESQTKKNQGAASATGYQGAASATGDRGAASATGYQGAASATGDWGAASATGDQSAASATGYQGAASATGDWGAASATGDQGAASATGKEGCAVALGFEGRVMGEKGNWLTIAEWEEKSDGWHRIDVQTARVDDKKIKARTWYALKGGKFVEIEA